MKTSLLLHICCAPCAAYVIELLREDHHVFGFFYNPNIHPRREYEFRRLEMEKTASSLKMEIFVAEYDLERWIEEMKHWRGEPERGRRCSLCFSFRLRRAFIFARDNRFDIVASTLSISPYKVAEQINSEGIKLSHELGVDYLAANFKKKNGFSKAKAAAERLAIKHQDYCGCVYSLVEKKKRLRQTQKI